MISQPSKLSFGAPAPLSAGTLNLDDVGPTLLTTDHFSAPYYFSPNLRCRTTKFGRDIASPSLNWEGKETVLLQLGTHIDMSLLGPHCIGTEQDRTGISDPRLGNERLTYPSRRYGDVQKHPLHRYRWTTPTLCHHRQYTKIDWPYLMITLSLNKLTWYSVCTLSSRPLEEQRCPV